MKNLNRLYPIKDVEGLADKFFVIDIETNGLEATEKSFIFACMYGNNYKKVFYSTKEIREELKKIKYKSKYIFAHNAEFDFTGIYGNIKKNLDREAIFNGRFIFAKQELKREKFKNGKERIIYNYFADSFNIFPTSVKNLGKSLGLEKMELDEKFKNATATGEITEKDIEYCYRDCEIVYKSLLQMFQMVGSVKPTLAGLAMLYYRRHYQPYSIHYNHDLSNEFFNSYYGGRVECFKLGVTHSYKYDINSMYPYAMVHSKFPNPKFLKKIEKDNITLRELNYYLKYREGQATITVIHKPTTFGSLPVKHNGKLIFPCGKFSGTWNFNEIRFALKKKLIKIIAIKSIVHSHSMESPFKKYADELYTKRKKAEGIYNLIYKLLLNSLYGKFAQRIKHNEIYYEDLNNEIILEWLESGKEHKVIKFNKERKDGYIHEKIDAKNKFHTIALFSSYITSFARVYLLEHLMKYRNNIVTYCDTDCICVEIPVKDLENSTELGRFKLEESFITELRGNKNYTEISQGIEKEKIKGVSKNSIKLAENKYEVVKLIKTKEAIRRNLIAGSNVKVIKELKQVYDKREIKKNGKTKILKIAIA